MELIKLILLSCSFLVAYSKCDESTTETVTEDQDQVEETTVSSRSDQDNNGLVRRVNTLTNNLQQCFCFLQKPTDVPVIQRLNPIGEKLERLVLYVYRDPSSDNIQMYLPNYEKQLIIPDLAFDTGDILETWPSDEIRSIFNKYPYIITSRDHNHIDIPDIAQIIDPVISNQNVKEPVTFDANAVSPSEQHLNPYPLSPTTPEEIKIIPDGYDVGNEYDSDPTMNHKPQIVPENIEYNTEKPTPYHGLDVLPYPKEIIEDNDLQDKAVKVVQINQNFDLNAKPIADTITKDNAAYPSTDTSNFNININLDISNLDEETERPPRIKVTPQPFPHGLKPHVEVTSAKPVSNGDYVPWVKLPIPNIENVQVKPVPINPLIWNTVKPHVEVTSDKPVSNEDYVPWVKLPIPNIDNIQVKPVPINPLIWNTVKPHVEVTNAKPVSTGDYVPWVKLPIPNIGNVQVKPVPINPLIWNNVKPHVEVTSAKPVSNGDYVPWVKLPIPNIDNVQVKPVPIKPLIWNTVKPNYVPTHTNVKKIINYIPERKIINTIPVERPKIWHHNLYDPNHGKIVTLHPQRLIQKPIDEHDIYTFDNWLVRELERVQFADSEAANSIDLYTLKHLIEETLRRSGFFIAQNGVLVDSNGVKIHMANLVLRPILIGNSVEYKKLLKGKVSTFKLPTDLPYLEAVLVTSIKPQKILGIIPFGKTYLPKDYRSPLSLYVQHTPQAGCNKCSGNAIQSGQFYQTNFIPNHVEGFYNQYPSSWITTNYRPIIKKQRYRVKKIGPITPTPYSVPIQREGQIEGTRRAFPFDQINNFIEQLYKKVPLSINKVKYPNKPYVGQPAVTTETAPVVPIVKYPGSVVTPGFRIIGGNAATSSGTPVSSKGRSGDEVEEVKTEPEEVKTSEE